MANNPEAFDMPEPLDVVANLPQWVPSKVVNYLRHTEEGKSLRDVARQAKVNASTVMRQVRYYESRRDDPLMDEALRDLALRHRAKTTAKSSAAQKYDPAHDLKIQKEGIAVLVKLAESGAVMAWAADMEKAIILRQLPSGKSLRTAVFDRDVAQALLIKDWISLKTSGKLSIYHITAEGRLIAQRGLAPLAPSTRQTEGQTGGQTGGQMGGLAEAPAAFMGQNDLWLEKGRLAEHRPLRRQRLSAAESPIQVLARRRDKDGKPFLSAELIAAADLLQEDFELAQIGPSVTQDWQSFLSYPQRAKGDGAAVKRVVCAMNELGPEMGALVIRVCCYQDGVEMAEQQMGWAARSGKIVLRIALQRLRRHYDETYGRYGPLVG